MTDVKIKQGTKKDAKKVFSYLKKSWVEHAKKEPQYLSEETMRNYSDSDLERYFGNCFDGSGDSILLIAEAENKLAGFLKVDFDKIQSFFRETKVAYLDDGFVIEKFRGQGIVQKLNEHAEQIAKERGIKWLKSRVYTFNKSAQSAMKKGGFYPLYSEYFKVIE